MSNKLNLDSLIQNHQSELLESFEVDPEIFESIQENREELAGRHDAAHIHEHLMDRVQQFQASLDASDEIGLQLANFGKAAEIHIRNISFKNPNLIEFSGVDLNNNSVTLVQHISQLNFLLIAVKPTEEKPYRIGF